MSRKHEKVQELLPEIQQLSDRGYTPREISAFAQAREIIDDYMYFYNRYNLQRIQTKTKLTPLEKRCQSVA